jgi:hypothetical protein
LSSVLLFVGLVGALAACGNPQYTYVKNSSEKTYFKIPAGWHKIETKPIDSMVTGDTPDSEKSRLRGAWSVAYDSADHPSVTHMVGPIADQPVVYASVYRLSPEERGAYSLDALRDSFLAVTAQARERTAQAYAAQGLPNPLSDFELLRDEELTPGDGLRGVRTRYNYNATPGGMLTIDLTAYLSDDGRVHLMIVRCSARCFRERASELESIASSFTVRKK